MSDLPPLLNIGEEMTEVQHSEDSLKEHEAIIEKSLKGYQKAAASLKAIKDNKLYKGAYSTYEEYCTQRWNFTPQYANRLIKAAEIVNVISKSETHVSVLPETEGQARALSKTKDLASAWRKVQKITGKDQPTVRDIEAFLQGESNDDTFDAEIIEEVHTDAETNTISYPLFADIINTPYKMGCKTGRPQVSVAVDDASIVRLNQLNDNLHTSKASIVAQALLLMEKALDLPVQPLPASSKEKSLFDINTDPTDVSGSMI